MQQFSKKINLYSMVKSYFSMFLVFILYTFGYSAINNPAGAEEFINSIMSFSPEVKILSITGILLLFLILIYEKLFNQKSSSQSSSSSTKGGASKASDIPLSTLAAGAELPDYDIINSSELINSQPVSISLAPSLINNDVLSITPLEIDLNNLQEWKFDGQEDKLSILKQIAPVVIKVLLCSMTAGIVMLSCGLAIEVLIKGQQFLPTMLELANSMSSFLGISSSTLLAVAFVPMVALTILSVLSKSPIYAQENIERVLDKSQSVEVVRVVVRSNGEERNPKSKVKAVIENVSHKNHYKNDWRGDSTNPFSPYFQGAGNCSNQQEVNDDDRLNPFSPNYNPGNCTTTLHQLTITMHAIGKVLC